MNTLITGASRGIGRALTEAALAEGQTVFAVSRSRDAFTKLQKDYPSTLIPVLADVSTAEGRKTTVQKVTAFGSLDILINNAGVLSKTDDESDFVESFHLNSIVPFLLTKDFLPLLKKAKEPCVVQISTMMGSIADNSSGGYYSYRSSKAALNMITKSLATDHPTVRFGLIHPGWVKTEMGGAGAPIEPEASAAGIWKVIHSLKPTQDVRLLDFRGRELPW